MSKTIIHSNVASSPLAGFRNRLINGNLLSPIDQRGGGVYTAATQSYTIDRWIVEGAAGTRVGVSSGGIEIYRNSGTGTTSIYQKIEFANWRDLKGKQVTLSMNFARYNNPGNVFFSIYTMPLETDGPGSMVLVETKILNVTANGVFNTQSVTFTVPNNTDQGLAVYINLSTPSGSDYIQVHSVQLEEGPVATPFELRPYSIELILCQRYYERSGTGGITDCIFSSYVISGATYYQFEYFNVEKRAVPTITKLQGGNSGFAADIPTFGNISRFGFRCNGLSNASSNSGYWQIGWTAVAEL